MKLHGVYQGSQKHYSEYYICDPYAHPMSYMSSFLPFYVSSCSGGLVVSLCFSQMGKLRTKGS